MPDVMPARADQISQVLALIQSCFAYMEDRIDPPSSMYDLTEAELEEKRKKDQLWVLGENVIGCMVATPQPDCLYLGKISIAPNARGKGHLSELIETANRIAKAKQLFVLKLETRIELIEVHKAFLKLGFKITGKGAHPGYSQPTFLTMQRTVS